jgi:hypothetical protein
VLAFEPGSADTKRGPPTGEYVECRDLLYEHAGVPIGHPRDHGAQASARCRAGEEAECCVRLEHRLSYITHGWDLEEMVHHPDGLETNLLSNFADLGET